jgi:hypothetical protein
MYLSLTFANGGGTGRPLGAPQFTPDLLGQIRVMLLVRIELSTC